jgi:hypothetical protein
MLPLELAIVTPLRSAGFTKKARSWRRNVDKTIQVINLQKSSFGDRLYVNLGVYVRALGPETSPPHNRCHVQVRLERVADPARQLAVSSAESGTTPAMALIDAVVVDGVAWLDGLSSRDGIRKYLESGGAHKGLVFAIVRQFVAT